MEIDEMKIFSRQIINIWHIENKFKIGIKRMGASIRMKCIWGKNKT